MRMIARLQALKARNHFLEYGRTVRRGGFPGQGSAARARRKSDEMRGSGCATGSGLSGASWKRNMVGERRRDDESGGEEVRSGDEVRSGENKDSDEGARRVENKSSGESSGEEMGDVDEGDVGSAEDKKYVTAAVEDKSDDGDNEWLPHPKFSEVVPSAPPSATGGVDPPGLSTPSSPEAHLATHPAPGDAGKSTPASSLTSSSADLDPSAHYRSFLCPCNYGVRLVPGLSPCPHCVEGPFASGFFRGMSQARMHMNAKCCPAQLSRPTLTDEQKIAVSDVANRVGGREWRCPFCVRKLSYQDRTNHVLVSCRASGQGKSRAYRCAAPSGRRSIKK